MAIKKEIDMDISKQSTYVSMHFPQGDNIDRKFYINLFDGSDEYIIPSSAIVRFQMTKRNGTAIYNNCAVINNQIEFEVTPAISAEGGRHPAQFKLTDSVSGGELKTFRFHILLEENVDIESVVVNSSEFTALQDMELRLGDADAILSEAEAATISANNAAISANNAATSANSKAELANDKATLADAAAQSANAATINANNARYLGDYISGTTYQISNIVRYQNALYICKAVTTGNLPTNTTFWDISSKQFAWKGEYNNTITYSILDAVSYLGSSYICSQMSIGNLPTNSAYFDALALKGDKGATLSPKGSYNASVTYIKDDLVNYNSSVWQCLQTSVGVSPTEGINWTVFLTGGGAIGDLGELKTNNKTTTVVAINENYDNINTINSETFGVGILSGLTVSAQSTPNMTVSVSTGTTYMPNGVRMTPATNASLAITTANETNPRKDIVYVNSSGVTSYLSGTAGTSPTAPSVPSGGIPLAEIYVGVGVTSITSANITDTRNIIQSNADLVSAINENKNSIDNKISKGELVINVKDYGAKGDGVTDDTNSIQNALNDGMNKTVIVPSGNYVISNTLVIKKKTKLIGVGRSSTTITMKSNTGFDMIISENFYTLTGTDAHDVDIYDISISHIALNGNYCVAPENNNNTVINTSGSGIKLYCGNIAISNVSIYNVPEHGLYTEFNSYSSSNINKYGHESNFDHIEILYSGKHGWWYNGPGDSQVNEIVIGSSSRSQHNIYYNFYSDIRGNFRITNSHFYSTYGTIKPKYSVYISSTSSAYNFTNCHIEGAATSPLYIENSENMFVNCFIYGSFGATDIITKGSHNTFSACWLGNQANDGSGLTLPTWTGAVLFGSNIGTPNRNNYFDVYLANTLFTSSFTNTNGANIYKLRGYNANYPDINSDYKAASFNIGGINSTDFIEILGDFGTQSNYKTINNNFSYQLDGDNIISTFQQEDMSTDVTISKGTVMLFGYNSGTLKLPKAVLGKQVRIYNFTNKYVPLGVQSGDSIFGGIPAYIQPKTSTNAIGLTNTQWGVENIVSTSQSQVDSTAVDITTIVNDFNSLLTKLRSIGILNS
jgi:hypothetical protein